MASIYKGLLPVIGGGAISLAMSPDEAEAAIRPDVLNLVNSALSGGNFRGVPAGVLESPFARKALEESSKYGGSKGFFTNHALKWRATPDPNDPQKVLWSPEKIADGHAVLYNSNDTVVIPNVLGRDPVASEALWARTGDGGSFYMPIVPSKGKKKGFTEITIYDPEAAKIERLLKEKGYWDGGPTPSSIFTPSLEAPVQPVGSGALSAVNNPMGTLADNPEWRKRFGQGGAATILMLDPTETSASDDPSQYGGLVGYAARDGRPAGNPAQDALVAAAQGQEWGAPVTWGDMRHGLSYGTRAALEGMGGAPAGIVNMVSEPLAGYSFPNAGVTLADAMGLDKPWNEGERRMAAAESLASEALPYVMGGTALSKYGAGAAQKMGK
jgi:hypothetical protein